MIMSKLILAPIMMSNDDEKSLISEFIFPTSDIIHLQLSTSKEIDIF